MSEVSVARENNATGYNNLKSCYIIQYSFILGLLTIQCGIVGMLGTKMLWCMELFGVVGSLYLLALSSSRIAVFHWVLCTWLHLEECTGLGAMPRSDHHSILTLLATSVPERLGSSIFLGVQEQSEIGVMSIWQCVCHSVVMQSVHWAHQDW